MAGRRPPVDEMGKRWVLSRAAAFHRTEYEAAGYWEDLPWFTCTELAQNFAKSRNGRVLTRFQVRRLIEKHDPELWRLRVKGKSGPLEEK